MKTFFKNLGNVLFGVPDDVVYKQLYVERLQKIIDSYEKSKECP